MHAEQRIDLADERVLGDAVEGVVELVVVGHRRGRLRGSLHRGVDLGLHLDTSSAASPTCPVSAPSCSIWCRRCRTTWLLPRPMWPGPAHRAACSSRSNRHRSAPGRAATRRSPRRSAGSRRGRAACRAPRRVVRLVVDGHAPGPPAPIAYSISVAVGDRLTILACRRQRRCGRRSAAADTVVVAAACPAACVAGAGESSPHAASSIVAAGLTADTGTTPFHVHPPFCWRTSVGSGGSSTAYRPCLEGLVSRRDQATGLVVINTNHRCGTVPGSHRTSLDSLHSARPNDRKLAPRCLCSTAVGDVTLLIGGVRSGKSALAVEIGRRHRRRGRVHRHGRTVRRRHAHAHRTPSRTTGPSGRPSRARSTSARPSPPHPPTPLLIVDCLTVWVANVLHHGGTIDAEAVAARPRRPRRGPSVVITNEVGLGVHPETELGRLYRDELGRVNQAIAAVARQTLLLVAGKALRLGDPWKELT